MYIKEAPFLSVLLKRPMLLGQSKTSAKTKAIQDEDIPVKILKENVNFFGEYICMFYNYAITTS